MPLHNMSWAKPLAEWRPLGPFNGPPLRMEHLTGGPIHRNTADLHVQVLLDDLVPPHEHQVYRSPSLYRYRENTFGWPPAIIITTVILPRRTYALSLDLLSHLNLVSVLTIVASSYFTRKQMPINPVAPYYFIIRRISVDTTAPYFFASKCFRQKVTIPNSNNYNNNYFRVIIRGDSIVFLPLSICSVCLIFCP
jgi:hypothetical protein